jgi:Tfp pilus assembly protein PilF
MRRLILVLSCALLTACASAPPRPAPDLTPLFDDAAFARSRHLVSAAEIFALSEPMRRFLAQEGQPTLRQPDPRRHLIELLYDKHKLALDYDSQFTRTAAQAFDAREGNCLALVIMTAAFAKALDLPVQYQSVAIDGVWSRSNGLVFDSGHVNLLLDTLPLRSGWERRFDDPLIVDFVPARELRGMRMRVIAERTVVAMFMNNRAAEALAAGRLDDAYWYARDAMRHDPDFVAAYNTMGVVYLRRGLAGRAEALFDAALRHEPDNTNVMDNLVQALKAQGRDDEAARVAQRLARIEPVPPFRDFDAGRRAMQAGEFALARALFEREVRREPDYHEFHFWLARALFELGEIGPAREQLQLALDNSTTARQQRIYAAKLDHLKAWRRQ